MLTGPLGSGKTARWRTDFERSSSARLLVPTATMARHLRHELARAGNVIRPGSIQTLAELTAELNEAGPAEMTPAALVLLVRLAIREESSAWGASAHTHGFQQAMANTIAELDARGYSASDVMATAQLVEDAPPEPMAFLRFFTRMEKKVREAGLALRSWRLLAATQRAFAAPLVGGTTLVLVDGFFSLTEPELGVLNALRRYAEVRISLPDWPGAGPTRQRLLQFGFTELSDEEAGPPVAVATARRELVTAGNFEAEVQEIARRILTLHSEGVAFREMGIILRDEQPYAGALRTALQRFGIPARFYFVGSLDAQPLFRYFKLLAAAARADWEHQQALAVIRCRLSGLGGTAEGDQLDFEIRGRLPSQGLEPLLMLHPGLAGLGRFDTWWRLEASAADLATKLKALFAESAGEPELDPSDVDEVARARNQRSSWRAATGAIDETARLLETSATPVKAAAFWEELATVASFTPVREPDERRDVVHVLDVYEARQWRLPVVFCPGLLEGRFPKHAFDDPLFPDRFRQRLIELGLPLRTLAERQQEEDFLFDLAKSRASMLFVASYPRFDRKGESTLPSFFLEGIPPTGEASPTRIAPRPSRAPEERAVLKQLTRVEAVQARHRHWGPARLESFLQCPYQFFGRYTMKLEGVPPEPEDRLDKLTQGSLVHEVLAFWQRDPSQPVDSIFERLFARACREKNTRPGYLLEMHRLEMLRHVREFTKRFAVPPGWRPECEVSVRFPLANGVEIRGRMDRVDVSPEGEAAVYDFKYSGGEAVRRKVRDHDDYPLVQGGLYLTGLAQTRGLQPKSFHYVALRDEAKVHGWSEPGEVRALMEKARELTLDAVARIREGEIGLAPRDKELCTYCELRDACRVSAAEAQPLELTVTAQGR